MTLKPILKILFLFISISVSSQVNNEANKKNAIDFLNLFLSDESWAMKVDANFTYNKYSNSLAFKSKTEIDDENKSIIKVDYVIDLDNIAYLEENIYKKGNIIFYFIYLEKEVYYKRHAVNKKDIIPDYSDKKVKRINLNFYKSLTDQDITNIKKAIRDVFEDTQIVTKYIKNIE